MRYPLRALSLLAGMACALTLFTSSPSRAYDDGACQPNCVCPQNYDGPNCSYGYPYGFDYYGNDDGDWSYGSRRHEDNHRTYGYDHGGGHSFAHGNGFDHAGGGGGHRGR